MTADLRRFRDVVADAVVTGSPDALRGARDVIVEAMRHSHLTAGSASAGQSVRGQPYQWRVDGLDEHTIRRRLALDLDAFLRAPTGRIGVCADVACQWVFLDISRGQNRRWCSSADCGNRHRAQRHQQRHATPHRDHR